MNIRILIIEDHPAQVELYTSLLVKERCGFNGVITVAKDCKSAYEIITDKRDEVDFELIFLDINLPVDNERNIMGGYDLGILIRKHLPLSKIIILTGHTGIFKIHNIAKKINPEGFLIKCDFTYSDIILAANEVLRGGEYKSETVKKAIKAMIKEGIYFDTYNQKIIDLLSQGVRTKNMPKILGLSISTIDKRKTTIKGYFNIENGDDEDIIRAAKMNNFI